MNRWNKLFVLSVFVVFLFALMDTMQIVSVHISQDWEGYRMYTQPAIQFLWLSILVVFGIFYYLVVRDKSEALGVALAPAVMLFFGVEDLFFFLIRRDWVTDCMSWFSYPPHSLINGFFGLRCTSFNSLAFTALFGVFVAYVVFFRLKRAKW